MGNTASLITALTKTGRYLQLLASYARRGEWNENVYTQLMRCFDEIAALEGTRWELIDPYFHRCTKATMVYFNSHGTNRGSAVLMLQASNGLVELIGKLKPQEWET